LQLDEQISSASEKLDDTIRDELPDELQPVTGHTVNVGVLPLLAADSASIHKRYSRSVEGPSMRMRWVILPSLRTLALVPQFASTADA